jgi:hypothetical protein
MKFGFASLVGIFALMFFSPTGYSEQIREAILNKVEGPVEFRLNGETDWKPAAKGIVLHEKDEVRTGEKGFALIHLDQKASTGKLELNEKSVLKLGTLTMDPKSGEKQTILDLAIGKVLVRAEKLRGDSKFEVKTPTATTGVRGTVFEVSAE